MAGLLNDGQMQELQAMLDQDAANPAPPEEAPEMEEAQSPDEVDTVNETVEDMSEGDGQTEDPTAVPDPNAQASAPQMPQLPDGFTDVGQLIAAYEQLKGGSAEMEALRDMTGQLASIAEALGYRQGIESVNLEFDETDPRAEVHKLLGPMIEQQERNVRQRLIDSSWKRFAGDHEDLKDMMDDIREIVDADPGLSDSERGLEIAYHLARSKRYRPEAAMMDDEAFIEKAAGNQKIRDRVIEDYLKQVAKGGEDAVKSIGGGGSTASSGKKKAPGTLEEATAAFRKMLGGN